MEERLVIQVTDSYTYAVSYARRHRDWSRLNQREYGLDAPCLPREAQNLTSFIDRLTANLHEDYPSGFTCRLILPTTWCLIHSVVLPLKRWNEAAALFEFEQYVPVDLEQLTCTVTRTGHDKALVAGVFTEAVRALLDGLEQGGIDVEAVTIDAFLLNGHNRPDPDRAVPILLDSRHIAMVLHEPDAANPASIRTVILPPRDAASYISRHIANCVPLATRWTGTWRLLALATREDLDDVACAFDSTGCSIDVVSTPIALGQLQDAVASAEDPQNLRQGELASPSRWLPIRRRLTWCLAAVAVFFVALGVRLRADNMRYKEAISDLLPQRAGIYQTVFPDGAPPPTAALRLRSECIKLEGLTERGDSTRLDPNSSGLAAFQLLHIVMANMPASLRLHVREITLDDLGLRFSGQTTGHGVAGDLVQQLNKVPGMTVDPPRTKMRKDGTVDFLIRMTRKAHDQ